MSRLFVNIKLMGRLVLCGVIVAAAWGQIPSSPVAQSPPPPPPPRAEVQPRKPLKIRLGQDQENPCTAPAAFWICRPMPSEQQLRDYEQRVVGNPEDVCARGQLIAHTADRNNHILWMIQNHPEWDGFTANPRRSLAKPHSERDENYVRFKEAWLRQIGAKKENAIVLHNAALFFLSGVDQGLPALADPELAIALMKRAIALDPNELVFVERLGLLYSYILRSASCSVRNTGHSDIAKTLVNEAEDQLRYSNDWVLLAGALTGGLVDVCDPDMPDLYLRLEEVRPAGEKPWSTVEKLPSRTSVWCRSKCVAPPHEFPATETRKRTDKK